MLPSDIDATATKNINLWLNGSYDEETKNHIRELLKHAPQEAIDAFYKTLNFGTSGLRAPMGVGCNRMNVYTVRATTQGLATYLLRQVKNPSVFIGYDTRHNSRLFAEEAAKVFAANQIIVFLCAEIRPTPLISFGCRELKCSAAIMITASHNPPQYNGYKIYWDDGAQVLAPHDQAIMDEVAKITDASQVRTVNSLQHALIREIKEEVDRAYLKAAHAIAFYPAQNHQEGHHLKIVYTPLHGTGTTLMPLVLAHFGFTNFSFVDKQVAPDESFTYAPNPDPAHESALQLGIEQMLTSCADILIATDPDGDRLGVAVLHRGKADILSGNQIAVLILAHICEALTLQEKMPKNAVFIKSIVTTEMFQAICDAYHKTCLNVLTGFKYVGEQIRKWEQTHAKETYIFGAEEAHGYHLGTINRDKDALIAAAVVCEMALKLKIQNKTLIDYLHEQYAKYGFFYEEVRLINDAESKEGLAKLKAKIELLRTSPPTQLNGIAINAMDDYANSQTLSVNTGLRNILRAEKANLLVFWLADGSKLMVRPSGTEPKIKLYCSVSEKCDDISQALARCKKKAQSLLNALSNFMKE